jgi:hypothetical protein
VVKQIQRKGKAAQKFTELLQLSRSTDAHPAYNRTHRQDTGEKDAHARIDALDCVGAVGEVTDYQTYEIDSSVGFGYSIGFSSSFTSLTPDTDYALVIYINGSGDIKTVLLNETRYFGTVLFDDAATLVLINALDTDDFGVDPAAVGLVLESDAGRVGLTLAALEAFTEPNVLTVSAGDYTLSVQQIGSGVEIAPPSDLNLEVGARRLVIITGLSDTQEDYGLSVLTLPD